MVVVPTQTTMGKLVAKVGTVCPVEREGLSEASRVSSQCAMQTGSQAAVAYMDQPS